MCQNYWSHKKQANVNKWDNLASYVFPDVITTYDCPVVDWMWFRIRRPNNGNWYFDISDNGKFWLNVGATVSPPTWARLTAFSSGPLTLRSAAGRPWRRGTTGGHPG